MQDKVDLLKTALRFMYLDCSVIRDYLSLPVMCATLGASLRTSAPHQVMDGSIGSEYKALRGAQAP